MNTKKVCLEVQGKINKHCPMIFQQSTQERGDLAFVPHFMTQTSLPKYHQQGVGEYEINIRNKKITIQCPARIGVPGGYYSRIIFVYLAKLAKTEKTSLIHIGNSMCEMMQSMGLSSVGGKNGNIETFKKHFISCINTTIHIEEKQQKETKFSIIPIIDEATITDLENWRWDSTIKLSDKFYESIIQKAIPTDIGCIKVLAPGTLRIDILHFLIYRLYYLKGETLISWKELQCMFSSPDIPIKNFKSQFKIALKETLTFYSTANILIDKKGLILKKSQLYIHKK
ncbi:MAG: replication protein RepA [Arenicella sp.]